MPPRHAGVQGRGPVLLTTLREKLALLKRIGIQKSHVLVFDRKTASTPPERFFEDVILKRYNSVEMIVGPDLAFGKDRAGRLPLLRRLGRMHGVRIQVIRPVGRGNHISSRAIRSLLNGGQVEDAASRLGYLYSAEGEVISGDRRGRKLGYPTANIAPNGAKILPPGVFWVKLVGSDQVTPSKALLKRAPDGLCNVGTRPTFTAAEKKLHCEVFVFRGKIPTYGQHLRVVFMRRLRKEHRFRSPEALQKQILKDLETGRRWASQSALHARTFSL